MENLKHKTDSQEQISPYHDQPLCKELVQPHRYLILLLSQPIPHDKKLSDSHHLILCSYDPGRGNLNLGSPCGPILETHTLIRPPSRGGGHCARGRDCHSLATR